MTNTNCLNCQKELTDKFCSGCGQKADTHRITFRNFLYHDSLHGTFHIEKGMLFTAKESLLNPGKAALNYISGKRKQYYNVFLLILVTFGVMVFIRHVDFSNYYDPQIVKEKVFPNEASKKLDKIVTQKIFIFLFIPLAGLNSFLLFRRKNLNLSEHFIISGMILLGILLIGTFANVLFQINLLTKINEMFLSWLVTVTILLYIGNAYFKTFNHDYSRVGLIFRTVLFFGLICIEIVILVLVIFGFLTNWKFGQLTLSPFG